MSRICLRIRLTGLSVRHLVSAVFPAGIDNIDLTIVSQKIFGCDIVHITFETMIEAGDFIPHSQISVKVQTRNGRIVKGLVLS